MTESCYIEWLSNVSSNTKDKRKQNLRQLNERHTCMDPFIPVIVFEKPFRANEPSISPTEQFFCYAIGKTPTLNYFGHH